MGLSSPFNATPGLVCKWRQTTMAAKLSSISELVELFIKWKVESGMDKRGVRLRFRFRE